MADKDCAKGKEEIQPDDITLESLFLRGSNSSPRKTDSFVDKDKETVDDMTMENLFLKESNASPRKAENFAKREGGDSRNLFLGPLFSGIKRGRTDSTEEADDPFSLSGIRKFLSNEETDDQSKRKAGELFIDIPEGEIESPLSTPRPNQRNILVHASPRVIKTKSEDGSWEQEFQLSTPIVRHSKSLALRRVTSMVFNSPQFQVLSPASSAKRRYHGSSSGRESTSIATDEDTGRLESLGDEHDLETVKPLPETVLSSQAIGKPLDRLPSAAARLAFQLKRQESELFEDAPKMTAKDIAFLQGKDTKGDSSGEFKLGRRRSGRSPLDGSSTSTMWGNRKDRRAAASASNPKTLPRWGHSAPVMEGHWEDQRIKTAVEIFCHHDSDVIADGTVPYALPCFRGKKEELMFINCQTLADVIEGRYDDVLDHYEIIDCRYPYEYAGGHIVGALNMFRAENIGEIMSWKDKDTRKRNVLIFHCEFSSQRAPAMMRLLRSTDRKHNADCYPYLCHPEIYLLEGGYKEFYAKYSHLCDPENYIPMVHSDYTSDLKKFLTRSTSWHGKDFRLSKHPHTLLI